MAIELFKGNENCGRAPSPRLARTQSEAQGRTPCRPLPRPFHRTKIARCAKNRGLPTKVARYAEGVFSVCPVQGVARGEKRFPRSASAHFASLVGGDRFFAHIAFLVGNRGRFPHILRVLSQPANQRCRISLQARRDTARVLPWLQQSHRKDSHGPSRAV